MSRFGSSLILFLLITAATSPLLSQTVPSEKLAPREVLLSEKRLATLKLRVEQRIEPTYTAWLDLQERAEIHIDREPHSPSHWYVPGYYRDAEEHRRAKEGLQEDANAVYELALCWRATGDDRYARTAVRLIEAWTTTVKSTSREDDSMLSFSYHFPSMIFGADLLASYPGFTTQQQEAFRRFCRETALPLNTMDRNNNWGNWGLVLAIACARYLGDDELLDRCEVRWKELLDEQIDQEGHLHHEVGRSGGTRGIWYSHFSLFPQTIAAEMLRLAGRDLYQWSSPQGRTLRQAFEPLARWTRDPASFPYWDGPADQLLGVDYYSYVEILNARWPNDDATWLLENARPMTARHSMPVLTYTHGGL